MELVRGDSVLFGLALTVTMGCLFTWLQCGEYVGLFMAVRCGLVGNIFFVATGFHGVHVVVGTSMLAWCWLRALLVGVAMNDEVGMTCAIWYWHFVDVVWLFLFTFVYWWVL